MQKNKVTIIAEAGVNHNGCLDTAKKLIFEAAKAGADYVKFQTFKADNLVSKTAPLADYQKRNTSRVNSQLQMLKTLELSFQDHLLLIEECEKNGIKFLSTGFDNESLDFLNQFDLDFFKVPSGEITNLPYLKKIRSFQKPIVLSTGMSTFSEVEDAIKVFKGMDLTVLHCNTEYPTPYEDVNLRVLNLYRDSFGVNVGYSDHTIGISVPIAAVALGATVIEKHFTLDNDMIGPDHKASLNPRLLSQMISSIREVEQAMGVPDKFVTESEKKNIKVARKHICASAQIKKGEIFSEENLTTKRCGEGISPMLWESVIGKVAIRDFVQDEAISL